MSEINVANHGYDPKVDGCICQICTCNKHHCTMKHDNSQFPFSGDTEYNQNYLEKSVPLQRRKNDDYVPNTNPFEGTTESHDKYIEFPISRKPYRKVNIYNPTNIPFDS